MVSDTGAVLLVTYKAGINIIVNKFLGRREKKPPISDNEEI